MQVPMTADDVLDREFLEVRAKLLQVAATLDRLDRSEGGVADDPRMANIQQALGVLQSPQPGRAEQLQLIFSLAYDEDWRKRFFGAGS